MQNDAVEFVGMAAEAIFYGMFIILVIGTLHVLFRKGSRPARLHYPMIVASFLMWILATTHLAIDVTLIFNSLFSSSSSPSDINSSSHPMPPPPHNSLVTSQSGMSVLDHLSSSTNLAKMALFYAIMILGDAIVIFRAFVVWNPRWLVVVLPILCSVASAILACLCLWATKDPDGGRAIMKAYGAYGAAVLLLSLCANLLAVGRTSLWPILKIMIESGVLNAAYLIVYIVLMLRGSSYLPIIGNMACPIVGIIFSLIIVRAGLQQSSRARYTTNEASSLVQTTVEYEMSEGKQPRSPVGV
ncbi:hypothetical protein DL96DRAFT_1553232 [Flagelloscypha sp. PMI_526]|nr:hypothetical protein DL96DRAFT_1553232 [Flagelloscypha sp. PMI_526]